MNVFIFMILSSGQVVSRDWLSMLRMSTKSTAEEVSVLNVP